MKIYTNFTEFLNEAFQSNHNYDLIMEGGAAGHMSHPFDEKDLTFDDFRKIVEYGLMGELNFEEEATEKTDGQNLFATYMNGEVMFARNATELKFPMTLSAIKKKFEEHPPTVKETFDLASEHLASSLPKLKAEDLNSFDNGKNWMNMELIYSKNPNVIHYDRDLIQFHNMKITDGEGNIIGEDLNPAKSIPQALEKANIHIGRVFTVIPPQVIKLAKDIDFESNKGRFLKKIDILQSKYNLAGSDPVMKYHETWWRETIDENFPDTDPNIKEGMFLRWAYDDKKTLNFRSLAKEVGSKEAADKIKAFDKNSGKLYKQNIRPFEDLFLELGSIILKNASNFVAANPSAEMQRLHAQIKKESEAIKKTGTEQQIAKVVSELERLERIGGVESIIPTEGIVFRYKGKTMKLTGTFAAINQLMGIIRFKR